MPGFLIPDRIEAVFRTVKGFLPDHEAAALYGSALEFFSSAVGLAVEIGSYCGKSTVLLGAAAQACAASVVTIDHHRGSDEHQVGWQYHDPTLVGADGLFDTLPTLRNTIARAGLENVVQPLIGSSAAVSRWWQTPVDFVFIDGGHTDPAARADLTGWAPWVRIGGGLAIHDVFPDPADGGQAPYRIWRTAVESGDFVEHAYCDSLRVLRRVRA